MPERFRPTSRRSSNSLATAADFSAAGLDVQLQIFQSGPVIAPAVVGGTLDVGAANTGSLAGALERGLPLKIFAPAAQVGPKTETDVIMVKADSPIKSAADVNGKTVAIVPRKPCTRAVLGLGRQERRRFKNRQAD